QADARAHVAHRLQARDRRARVARVDLVLAPLAGADRPEVAVALVGRRPRVAVRGAVAVAVAVVAEEPRAGVRRAPDRRVDDAERAGEGGVLRGQDAEADELEEARVDHLTLVEGGAAVADVVGQ